MRNGTSFSFLSAITTVCIVSDMCNLIKKKTFFSYNISRMIEQKTGKRAVFCIVMAVC